MLHMKTTLRIGTRGSELALKQTEMAIEAIKAHNPQVEAEIVIIKTDGDTHTDIPLCKVNKTAGTQDKGVFVAAIERALAAGEIDCAVHSMPGQPDPAFEISAVLPREDIWDALILKKGADTAHLTLGTASVRREQLIRTYWSGTAKTVSIRGNVHTRLRKLIESDAGRHRTGTRRTQPLGAHGRQHHHRRHYPERGRHEQRLLYAGPVPRGHCH